jgi:hypothetical protein
MSGRPCSVCNSESLQNITLDIGQGIPFSELAIRYGLKPSSLQRHAARHQGLHRGSGNNQAGHRNLRGRNIVGKKTRPETGRCTACGLLTAEGSESLTPADITRRAERVLNISEGIALKAEASEDSRLALLAVDRCQRSIDTLAKIAGMIRQDIRVEVKAASRYDSWPKERLQALQTVSDALDAGDVMPDALEAFLGQVRQGPKMLGPAVVEPEIIA